MLTRINNKAAAPLTYVPVGTYVQSGTMNMCSRPFSAHSKITSLIQRGIISVQIAQLSDLVNRLVDLMRWSRQRVAASSYCSAACFHAF